MTVENKSAIQSEFERHGADGTDGKNSHRYPRLLVFDLTHIGGGTATGELKQALFGGWPYDRYLQFYGTGSLGIGLARLDRRLNDGRPISTGAARQISIEFDPEVILYRPVPDNAVLHDLAMSVIDELAAPLMTWIVDDWPTRLLADQPTQAKSLENDLKHLLRQSQACLSVCDAMSQAFEARYGVAFRAFANAVNPEDWRDAQQAGDLPDRPFVIRYAGALADNMTRESVLDVARAVEDLADKFPITLEINTQPHWFDQAKNHLSKLKNTRVSIKSLTPNDYRAWLRGGDAVLIAYNFDRRSMDYARYSMANKMPECLASGAVVLVVGPKGVATVDYLDALECTQLVDEPSPEKLKAAIRELKADPNRRRNMAAAAQKVAFEKHNLKTVSGQFRRTVVEAVTDRPVGDRSSLLCRPFTFDDHASMNESLFVWQIATLKSRANRAIMVDVGAHHGSSLSFFVEGGWQVYGFEPDPVNRQKLIERYGQYDNLEILSNAVSDVECEEVDFFSSDVSSGISSLKPFHSSHKISGVVTTTTLNRFLQEHELDHIDFLKIDVEGFEMDVMRGLDFMRVMPDYVLVEYENGKTVPRGYTSHDLAEFLAGRNYQVFVSEWHPITQYGKRHNWRCLKLYPCDIPEASWGNLIAVKTELSDGEALDALGEALNKADYVRRKKHQIFDAEEFEQTLESILKKDRSGGAIRQAVNFYKRLSGHSDSSDSGLPYLYTRIATDIERRNTTLFQLGQFVMWSLRLMRRNMAWVAAFVLLAVIAPAIVAVSSLGDAYRPWPTLVSGGALLGLLIALVLGFTTTRLNRKVKQPIKRGA